MPTGTLGDGVQFEVYADVQRAKRHRRALTHIGIYEYEKAWGGAREPVWLLEGKRRLERIVYGKVPKGFEESMQAVPLVTGTTYYVKLDDSRGGAAIAKFTIASNGNVVAEAI